MPPPATSTQMWCVLTLPPAAEGSTEALAALLDSLRIPAAVRDSRWDGPGTIAVLPHDGHGSMLALPDTFAPATDWSPVDVSALADALDESFGPGSVIDGRRLRRREEDTESDALSGLPRIDAIAWTTTENREFIEMLGARLGMSFDAIDAGELGQAMRPNGDPQEAFDRGAWALTDGIAVMSTGGEQAAAFVSRRDPVFVTWCTPWTLVDPSKPGQILRGVPVKDLLVDAIATEQDVAPWVSRFGLDDAGASRLRALFRLGPSPDRLDELFHIIGLDADCLRMLRNDLPTDAAVTVITPRTARQQFVEEIRSGTITTGPPENSFRRRHRGWWLTISACGILALSALAVTGLAAGRPTAFLPGITALIWIAALALDLFAKNDAVDASTPLAEPESDR